MNKVLSKKLNKNIIEMIGSYNLHSLYDQWFIHNIRNKTQFIYQRLETKSYFDINWEYNNNTTNKNTKIHYRNIDGYKYWTIIKLN